jgi:hypothetical protein
MLEYSIAVSRLVREESALLTAHEEAVRAQQDFLPAEQELLETANAGTDHDLEAYLEKLEVVVSEKIRTLEDVRRRMVCCSA